MSPEISQISTTEFDTLAHSRRKKIRNSLFATSIAGTIIFGGNHFLVQTHSESIDLEVIAACSENLEPLADGSQNPTLLTESFFGDTLMRFVCVDANGNVEEPASVGIVSTENNNTYTDAKNVNITVEYNRSILNRILSTYQPSFETSPKTGFAHPGEIYLNAQGMNGVFIKKVSVDTTTKTFDSSK